MSNILVIDDSLSILAFVSQELAATGHTVITAANGKEGLDRLRESQVDLVITDMYMPEGDGIEVIREARKTCPGSGVVVMSGRRGDLNMFAVAKSLGVFATLQKPFTREQLLEQVTACLNRQPKPTAKELAL
jgi:DNA-binding NtrC family response regulator